jgi:hypothetical protein
VRAWVLHVVVVLATWVERVSNNAAAPLEVILNINPDNNFRYCSILKGYVFALQVWCYPRGTYRIHFTAGADPTDHTLEFQVR